MPEPAPSAEAAAASGQEPAMGAREPEPVAKAGDGQDAPQEAAEPGAVVKSALALVYDRDRRLAGVCDADAILQRVAKADGGGEKKPMQAVFDQDGDLIGIVDPDAIQPVTGAGGKPASDAGAAGAAPAADDADASASDGDMTPQPPADAGTPAGADDDGTVAKNAAEGTVLSATNHLISPDALESIIAKAVAAALDGRPAEDIAKQADVAGLTQEVETLKARLATVEEQPAAPKVFTNGQVPPASQLRGQDQGVAQPVDVAKALELKHELYTADAPRQKQIADDMQQMAIDQLAAIHARR